MRTAWLCGSAVPEVAKVQPVLSPGQGRRRRAVRPRRHRFGVDIEQNTRCRLCGGVVDPNGPDVTFAVEYLKTHAMDTDTSIGTQYLVRDDGYFHPGCSPAAMGWHVMLPPI